MVFALVFLVTLYFLPSIVAVIRQVPNMGSVVVVNIFFGWTFVGWVAALAMAARSQINSSVNVLVQPHMHSGYPIPPSYVEPLSSLTAPQAKPVTVQQQLPHS